MLAAPRSTYLVGPVSGLQLAAALLAILAPVFLGLSGLPGWAFLVLFCWQVCAISAIRRDGVTGWGLLRGLWRDASRARPAACEFAAPSEPGQWTTTALSVPREIGTSRRMFAAAPGRLARATITHTGDGDLFVLPRPGGTTKPGRITAAWQVTGPAYALLDARDQDTAIGSWAAALNRLSTLPGLVGLAVHERSDARTGLVAARAWHHGHADDDAVPVAAANYTELLDTIDARDASCVIAVTFDPRRVPGKAAGIPALVAEVPAILRDAGITMTTRLTGENVIDALMDVAQPVYCEHSATRRLANNGQVAQAPVFPSFEDTKDCMVLSGMQHTVIAATTATAVAIDGGVLAPLMTARAGVQTAIALTIRPLPPDQTQARARARHVKLRRQRAAADSSSMSGLLIDTHRLDQEMASLHALGADAARGSVETELVITVVLSTSDATHEMGSGADRLRAARAALIRDASPLRFTPVAYPTPAVLFTRAPIGGLL